MASRPLLYAYDISHYCVSADRILAFKGVDFDTRYVPYHDKTELIKATGQDYVPTLIWDSKPVMWYDIPDFLETVRPKPSLYPDGQRGLAVTLEHWGHQVLEERVWRYVVTKVPRVLHDDVERWVFEEMQTRARGPWHVLEMRREEEGDSGPDVPPGRRARGRHRSRRSGPLEEPGLREHDRRPFRGLARGAGAEGRPSDRSGDGHRRATGGRP